MAQGTLTGLADPIEGTAAANPLTGDFDAVLQVSGGTVNRLLASMHQNAGAKPALPSFPHSVTVPLGQYEAIDGVRGTVTAQVSVPRVQLVDGATDRLGLEVWVRARYLPEPGSEPLADWIAGKVTAEYALSDIGASKRLGFEVVQDSVSFEGTVASELDEAATIEKVVRQLRSLLSTSFSAVPHRVSERFRRGSMMSLNRGGEAAIVIPLSPDGPQIGSIDQVVLGGADFGVALSADAIVRQIRSALDRSATVEWTGNGVTVGISGQAVTLVMSFDAGSERLVLRGEDVLDQVAFDVSAQKAELVDQLRTIDDNADAHFVDARFDPAGVVLLGTIRLSPRRGPVLRFERTSEGHAYTAWESWIPGGRIDTFDWSWRWAAGSFQQDGSRTEKDTFLLTRSTPLPGLDGVGEVCLHLEGAQVDGRGCQTYNWGLRVPWGGSGDPGCNTLVVHVGESFAEETAAVVQHGLAACRRQDAGLVVLILFDDGHLARGERDAAGRLRELAGGLEAPMLVNEDVDGGWAAPLRVPERREQPSWRLLSPSGAVVWMSDDAVTAETLGAALDQCMSPSDVRKGIARARH